MANALLLSKIDPDKLAHLSLEQHQELLAVVDRYPECFSETPGYCDMVEHEIIVTPERCTRAKYITMFDGKSSYWTIPIEKKHQWLTGFIDGYNRLWEWTHLPSGLHNSGSSFVCMLQNVLYPI